jgi:hypothetical protein
MQGSFMNVESLFNFKVIGDQKVARHIDFTFCEGQYILDEQGEPVIERDLFKWGEWLEEAVTTGSRHLAEDTIGPYRVSTVFLGLDHAYGNGPPVLWETIIFGTEEEMEIIPGKKRRYRKTVDQFRYTSKAEALAGHARAVKLAESLPQPVTPAEGSGP